MSDASSRNLSSWSGGSINTRRGIESHVYRGSPPSEPAGASGRTGHGSSRRMAQTYRRHSGEAGEGHFPVISGTGRTVRCSVSVRGRHPARPRLPPPVPPYPVAGAGVRGTEGARYVRHAVFIACQRVANPCRGSLGPSSKYERPGSPRDDASRRGGLSETGAAGRATRSRSRQNVAHSHAHAATASRGAGRFPCYRSVARAVGGY